MRTVLATLISAVVLVAALAGPAAAIDNGSADGTGHPNVGLLAFDVDGPGGLPPIGICTGSVISDHVFLTAAHCIDTPLVPPGVTWGVTLAAGSEAAPVISTGYYPDFFPDFLTVPFTPASAAVVHPSFGQKLPYANDVALVIFPAGTFAGVTPVQLPQADLLDSLAAHGGLVGSSLTLVGYGTDATRGGGESPRFYDAGYRKTATAPFAALTPNWLRLLSAQPATGGGSLCIGDSGSPQFLHVGSTDVEVSLHSTGGDTQCTGTPVNQRLDIPSVRQFLGEYVALP